MRCPIQQPALTASALIVLATASACTQRSVTASETEPRGGPALVVRRASLAPTLLLTGELESAQSEKIYIPRTPAWQLPIRWMERDGAEVREGQKVLELDNTQFTGDLEQKKLAHSSAYNDLARKKADLAGEVFEKEFVLEQRRIAMEKARIEASIPRELRSDREHQEHQLALVKAEFEHAKALEELEATRRAAEAETEELRLAYERAGEEITTAERAIDALTLTAPRSGILIVAENRGEGRKFQVGDNAWVGLPVMSIPDLDAMQVVARLSDVDDGRIEVGAQATCTLDAYPGTTYRGRVVEIAPVAQEDNPQSLRRSFKVVIALDDSDPERMRPGMSVKVEIGEPSPDEGLVVPRVALDLGSEPVMAMLADGSAVAVRLGPCTAGECIVEEGLEEGASLRRAG